MGIDFLIPAFNEEVNLPHAIRSVSGWADRIFVLDSGSTDRTADVARELGATLVYHPWEGYARQKNWALDNLPFNGNWTFILDADESVTEDLKKELLRIASAPPDTVPYAGYYVNRLFVFMGRPIRHCGYFPSWNLRLFKRGKARYEDRAIHEHMVTQGREGYLRGLLWHEDRRGMEFYIAKHNRYSSLEAETIYYGGTAEAHRKGLKPRIFGSALQRRRFLRERIYPMLPGKWLFRFLYMYVLQRGFMDGLNGFRFCLFISTHEFFTYLKVLELDLQRRAGVEPHSTATSQILERTAFMPQPTPDPNGTVDPATPADVSPATGSTGAAATSAGEPSHITLPPMPPDPAPATPRRPVRPVDRQESAWTFREKINRALWMLFRATLFRWSFHNWYGWRSALLRMFGARIGRDVRIRPTACIEIPWNLQIGDRCLIGDHVILYSLGKITLGNGVIVSQYAHLCAGTHDYTSHQFPLLRLPIEIGDEAWIAADAFVAPGTKIGARAVVGARSSVFNDIPAEQVVVGSPARFIKQRVFRD